ncbi:rod shape-determining protein MreC [Candidatus Parcubacteria bacterium]|nr:MAG: rod shape-determining protein MreC [Candidatus Parcubacteria bacterium]
MLKIFIKKIFKYLLALIAVFVLYAFGLLSPLEGVFLHLFNPVFSRVQNLSISFSEKYYEQTSKVDIAQRNRDLEKQVSELLSKNAELEIVKEENETMRGFLNFFSENKFENVMAEVISRGDFSDSAGRIESITIDKGSDNGLYDGLVVINQAGLVVGKIINTKDAISEVALLTNKDCKLAATILGEDKTSGIVEGELGLTMTMNFIPQSKSINKEDIVVTSGLERTITRGLVIGQISEVIKESNELWQEAVLESNINFNELTIVSVLLPVTSSEQ